MLENLRHVGFIAKEPVWLKACKSIPIQKQGRCHVSDECSGQGPTNLQVLDNNSRSLRKPFNKEGGVFISLSEGGETRE